MRASARARTLFCPWRGCTRARVAKPAHARRSRVAQLAHIRARARVCGPAVPFLWIGLVQTQSPRSAQRVREPTHKRAALRTDAHRACYDEHMCLCVFARICAARESELLLAAARGAPQHPLPARRQDVTTVRRLGSRLSGWQSTWPAPAPLAPPSAVSVGPGLPTPTSPPAASHGLFKLLIQVHTDTGSAQTSGPGDSGLNLKYRRREATNMNGRAGPRARRRSSAFKFNSHL